MPIMPNGTEILEIFKPFGCVHFDNSTPIGSLISEICFKPSAILSILLLSSKSLSIKALLSCFLLAFSISILFALRISSCSCFMILDVFNIAKFLSFELLLEMTLKASLDFLFIFFIYSKMLLSLIFFLVLDRLCGLLRPYLCSLRWFQYHCFLTL